MLDKWEGKISGEIEDHRKPLCGRISEVETAESLELRAVIKTIPALGT